MRRDCICYSLLHSRYIGNLSFVASKFRTRNVTVCCIILNMPRLTNQRQDQALLYRELDVGLHFWYVTLASVLRYQQILLIVCFQISGNWDYRKRLTFISKCWKLLGLTSIEIVSSTKTEQNSCKNTIFGSDSKFWNKKEISTTHNFYLADTKEIEDNR